MYNYEYECVIADQLLRSPTVFKHSRAWCNMGYKCRSCQRVYDPRYGTQCQTKPLDRAIHRACAKRNSGVRVRGMEAEDRTCVHTSHSTASTELQRACGARSERTYPCTPTRESYTYNSPMFGPTGYAQRFAFLPSEKPR